MYISISIFQAKKANDKVGKTSLNVTQNNMLPQSIKITTYLQD